MRLCLLALLALAASGCDSARDHEYVPFSLYDEDGAFVVDGVVGLDLPLVEDAGATEGSYVLHQEANDGPVPVERFGKIWASCSSREKLCFVHLSQAFDGGVQIEWDRMNGARVGKWYDMGWGSIYQGEVMFR